MSEFRPSAKVDNLLMERSYARVIRDIPYAGAGVERAVGDLFLPANIHRGHPVLLIHGGGWNGASKEFFEFMLPIFGIAGRPVFNINYRYLSQAPWPACLEDTLAAARHVLDGGLAELGLPAGKKLLLCGASSGGHLAMMAGLKLTDGSVEGVVSMAGPSRIDWVADHEDRLGMHKGFLLRFFGRDVALDGKEIQDASPALAVRSLSHVPAPLFCLHSSKDLLCPSRYSEEAIRAWQEAGGQAMGEYFEGNDDLHGFWVNSDRESDILRPEVLVFFARVFNDLGNGAAGRPERISTKP